MKKFTCLALLLILSACGSTSSLRDSENPEKFPDLSTYKSVIVNDFTDGVSSAKDDPNIISEGKKFADIITSDIKSKHIFGHTKRNVYSTENALLIDGEITQHDEGSAVARTLIGLGAGSSHFDANVYIKDNTTKQVLGSINVDQMSWALGGIIAGTQDVKSHMHAASSKIADELKTAKNGSVQ